MFIAQHSSATEKLHAAQQWKRPVVYGMLRVEWCAIVRISKKALYSSHHTYIIHIACTRGIDLIIAQPIAAAEGLKRIMEPEAHAAEQEQAVDQAAGATIGTEVDLEAFMRRAFTALSCKLCAVSMKAMCARRHSLC